MSTSLEAKIVVLGAQGVGKTSLLLRYIKNQFAPKTTTSTVGASFMTKRVLDDESDTVVRLQIWDTAGQERFRWAIPYSIWILVAVLEIGGQVEERCSERNSCQHRCIRDTNPFSQQVNI